MSDASARKPSVFEGDGTWYQWHADYRRRLLLCVADAHAAATKDDADATLRSCHSPSSDRSMSSSETFLTPIPLTLAERESRVPFASHADVATASRDVASGIRPVTPPGTTAKDRSPPPPPTVSMSPPPPSPKTTTTTALKPISVWDLKAKPRALTRFDVMNNAPGDDSLWPTSWSSWPRLSARDYASSTAVASSSTRLCMRGEDDACTDTAAGTPPPAPTAVDADA